MSQFMTNLEHLNVKHNDLKDQGAHVLAIGNLRKLKYLNINQNSIKDLGYKAIADSE